MTTNKNEDIATLAGGCFWGMEELFRKLPGVLSTVVGYTGGETPQAKYEMVKTGRTGHAEALRVTFDPQQLSYERVLLFFFSVHDPTTEDRQGNDRGTQYRSAIFYHSEEQKKIAEAVMLRVEKAGHWKSPLVTELTPANEFYTAEDYHQKYLQKNPGGYTCHWTRPFKF